MIKNRVMINKNNLIVVFDIFKASPHRVFLAKDLFVGNTGKKRTQYLKTLVRMGLLEEVDVIYRKGNVSRRGNGITGYKLKGVENETSKEM